MTVQSESGSRVNGIDLGVLTETVEAIRGDPELGKCTFRVNNQWVGGTHNRTAVEGFYGAKREMSHKQRFQMEADEPAMLSGEDTGANPVEHLLNALASCVTTSIIVHAAANGIRVEELESRVEGDLDLRGVLGLSKETPRGFTEIRMRFRAKAAQGDLERLKGFAAYSPVLNTITKGARVDVEVEGK